MRKSRTPGSARGAGGNSRSYRDPRNAAGPAWTRTGAIVHALDPGLHPDRIVGIADDARVRMLFFDLSFMPLVEEISPRLAAATTFIALTNRSR